jgi:hypothetical protein
VGLEAARNRVVQLHADAIAALASQGWDGGPLAELAAWLLGRRH